MHRVNLDGVDLEYDVQGSGEPVLLIHGSIVADAFFPLLVEPSLTSNYRVISYHRRGFAGSTRASSPFTMAQQAADGRALLHHLGLPRVHVAGHSYGAAIAMQWALDAPAEVCSLALLEPPLMEWVPSGPEYWEWVASVRESYAHGEKAGVTDAGLDHGIGHIMFVEVDSEEQEVAPPISKSPQTSNAASDRKIAPPLLSRRAG